MTLQQRIEKAVLLLQEHGFIVTPPTTVTVIDPSIPTFDDFFDAYGKKVGRTRTERLWISLTPQEKRDCMAYVPLYVRNTKDKQYRKNPETFLRNKSWNDELISNNNGQDARTTKHQAELSSTLGRIQSLINS